MFDALIAKLENANPNEGNVERHTLDRLGSFVAGTAGKRLTYKDLIQ